MTVRAGLSVGLISKAKKNSTDVTSETISRILVAYPELSPTWLMTGCGDMLAKKNIANAQSGNIEYLQTLLDRLQEQSEEIGRLKSLISSLQS